MKTTTPRLTDAVNEFGSFEIRWSELRNGVWRSCRRSAKTGDIEEARLALARFLLDRQRLEPETRHTVGAIFDAYCKDHLEPRGELANTRHLLRAPRLAFGDRDPLSITQDEIDAYVRDRCAGMYAPSYRPSAKRKTRRLQPQSAGREVSTMQAALNWGSRRLMVFGKPAFRFERPEAKGVRVVWLDEAQKADVTSKLHLASRSVQLFTLLGWTYGVRRGAMMDLSFGPQVSFISNSIDFNVPGKRRTRKRRAVVPMTEEIRHHLEVLFQERVGFVLDRYTYRHFAEFMDSIGYEWVTPHVLKHTAITLMLRAGWSPSEVAGATETSLRTVLEVYRHFCADEKLAIFTKRKG
jgi:integrase